MSNFDFLPLSSSPFVVSCFGFCKSLCTCWGISMLMLDDEENSEFGLCTLG